VFAYLGGILSSLIVGRINDKLGVKAGLIWGGVANAVGYSLMFLSYSHPTVAYLAIFVVGLGSCMYTVQCPLLARNIVGSGHYSEIWSLMMMINSLIGGGLYSTIGLFYDKTGTYRGAFIMAIVLFVTGSIFGILSIDLNKRRKEKQKA
jgi:MFS family permease